MITFKTNQDPKTNERILVIKMKIPGASKADLRAMAPKLAKRDRFIKFFSNGNKVVLARKRIAA